MTMQLKSLRIFCDVVRHGSFSRAADELGLSQSAASQVVQQLEESLGVKLIDRSKRPWVVTPEGDHYYRGCRKIVHQYSDLESQVQSFNEAVEGCVQIASIFSVGLSYMTDFIRAFQARHPEAEVKIRYDHPLGVHDRIERDAVDIGIVSYPKASRQMVAEPWRREPMILACAPQHPLARREHLTLEDLAGRMLVAFDDGLTIRRQLDKAFEAAGVTTNVAMEFDNIEMMKRAIETNSGVGLLPAPTVQREVKLGSLRALPLLDADGSVALERPLGFIHRRRKRLSPAALRFVRELQTYDHGGYGSLPGGVASCSIDSCGDLPGQEAPRSGRVTDLPASAARLATEPVLQSAMRVAGQDPMDAPAPTRSSGMDAIATSVRKPR